MVNEDDSAEQASTPGDETNEDDNVKTCRICWDTADQHNLIRPCSCGGTGSFAHVSCIQDWLAVNPLANSRCVVCRSSFRLPRSSRYARRLRNLLRFVAEFVAVSIGFVALVAYVVRPLAFILWCLFSATSTDPFDSPLFLYMIKAKESWNDVELDVDMALEVKSPAQANLAMPFVRRLLSANAWSCSRREQYAADLADSTLSFLNTTCGVHPLFRRVPAFRFCSCAEDQTLMARRLARVLELTAPAWNCSYEYNKEGADASSSLEHAIRFVLSPLNRFAYPMKGLIDFILPVVYGKYHWALPYVKYLPHRVRYSVELHNPRLYGLPFEFLTSSSPYVVSYARDEMILRSRVFVIKSLDYHFCMMLICGLSVDALLFVRLWYSGLGPLLENLFQFGTNQVAGSGNGSESQAAAAEAHGIGGHGSAGVFQYVSSWLHETKMAMQEQWQTFMVISVVNVELAKAWWFSSDWVTVLADIVMALSAVLLGALLYVYLMVIVSLVVLHTFDTDILVDSHSPSTL